MNVNETQTPIFLTTSPTVTYSAGTLASSSSSVYYIGSDGNSYGYSEESTVKFNLEEVWDAEWDKPKLTKIEVRCPHCAYPNHPWMRKNKPEVVHSGEEWVGVSYKQPYSVYRCMCVYCDELFYTHLYTPQ